MLTVLLAFLAGVLTVLSPCVLPVLPLVFARVDRPFRSHGLPMLLGMGLSFSAAASLVSFGGEWVVSAHEWGRTAALLLAGLFGLGLLMPTWAERASRPWVALGARLSDDDGKARPWRALVLGVGTGLLWTPCAGPILGLILTGAALNGASVASLGLLLAYAAGACVTLAVALLAGRRLFARIGLAARSLEHLRRGAGALVLVAVVAIASGLDTGWLAGLSADRNRALEDALLQRLEQQPAATGDEAKAAMPVSATRDEGVLSSLGGAGPWINSPPLPGADLRGKVVLVDFWTYSCINCLRTLPYAKAWADKYRDAGLVVLGVHAPEFAFERSPDNVRRAVRELGIGYPVVLDNGFSVWRAFGNRYWPAFYVVDAQGRIRHHQFGEGGYAQTERALQSLLAEAGRRAPDGLVSPQGSGTQAATGPRPAVSSETYLGYEQAGGFASPGGLVRDREQDYRAPATLDLDSWSLAGHWQAGAERIEARLPAARIAMRFRARDLHLVLGPGADGKPVRFSIRIDGRAPGADHGSDVDAEGRGLITGERLYQLVRQQGDAAGERLFEIEFEDAGARAWAFTFG